MRNSDPKKRNEKSGDIGLMLGHMALSHRATTLHTFPKKNSPDTSQGSRLFNKAIILLGHKSAFLSIHLFRDGGVCGIVHGSGVDKVGVETTHHDNFAIDLGGADPEDRKRLVARRLDADDFGLEGDRVGLGGVGQERVAEDGEFAMQDWLGDKDGGGSGGGPGGDDFEAGDGFFSCRDGGDGLDVGLAERCFGDGSRHCGRLLV